MEQYNVHEAKSNLSRLLEKVESGEEVILSRRGKPIARIVPLARGGIVLGAAVNDPNINREALERDDWWKAMTGDEAETWLESRS